MRRRASILGLGAALMAGAALFGATINDRARLIAPAPTPILHDRHGVFLTQIGNATPTDRAPRIDYGYWPLATLPDRVVRATLALEDRRFREHPGFDPVAAGRAFIDNLRGRPRSGASTIAMQVARMQQPASRTLMAKLREAAIGVALTVRYGREGLLAHYLRLLPYGNGSHGISHAARFYFDKPVDDLSWAEIALLSAIPQSPSRMNPLRPDGVRRAMRRGHRALDELARQGVINVTELALAHRQLDALPPPRAPRRPDALQVVLRYEALYRDGKLQAPSPNDPRITAMIDLDAQAEVTRLARRYLNAWRDSGAQQVAVMVVDRDTRAIVANIGSNDTRDGAAGWIDFSRKQRSPGSTLKPFIYALALERGVITPADVLADLPEGASMINNADGHFLGPMLPRQALANSRNVPATNLLRATGLDRTLRFLHALGLHDLETPADSFGLSMAIGSLPTTLDRLVRAYGALADDGRMSDIVWARGQKQRDPTRVMSADSARLVTSFLSDPMARLPSFPRYGPTEYPFPVALKTGTSQGYRDAWTVAWSRRYVVGVWIGRGDAGTMTRLSGVGSAARLTHAILMRLHGSRPGDLDDTGFPPPEGRAPVELCVFGGKRSSGDCGQTLTEWLRPDEIPAREESLPRILAETDQRATMQMPAAHRAWASAAGYHVADEPSLGGEQRLAIVAPENNTRVWLNPDTPAAAARIALKAVVEPRAAQVVWYVDGAPYAMTDPDKPVYWPIAKGAHRFQLRLPLQPGFSKTIHVVVE
jgi:penicillin-binding protein 1C